MRPIHVASILEEVAGRLTSVKAANAVIFSIHAFSEAHPDIWKAVQRKLGVINDASFHYIASGRNGSAYLFGHDEVVKFTIDQHEIEAMAKVKGQELEYIVSVTDVFRFPYKGQGNIGCVRQEKLQPGAPDWKNFGDLAAFYFDQILDGHPFEPAAMGQFKDWAIRQFKKRAQSAVVAADEVTKVNQQRPNRKKPEKDTIVIREDNPDRAWDDWVSGSAKMPTDEMFEWLTGLTEELAELGIAFNDTNAGNMMKRNGVHVVIDLGRSLIKSPPKIDDTLIHEFSQQIESAATRIERMILAKENKPCNKCGRTDYDDIRAGLCDACAFPNKKKAEAADSPAPDALGPKELTGLPNIWKALAAKLSLDPNVAPRFIAEGSNGSAYLVNDGTVLKLTKDRTEAVAMAKLIGRHSKYIVNVFRVLNIGNKLFAISMEKLGPPDPDWKKLFAATEKYFSMEEFVNDETVKAFAAQWQKEMPATEGASLVRADGFEDWGDINPGDDVQLDNINTKQGIPWPGPFDAKKIHWLQGLAHELIGLDIKFGDMNVGNVMKRGGDHVVIDLGMSKTNSAPQLETLE